MWVHLQERRVREDTENSKIVLVLIMQEIKALEVVFMLGPKKQDTVLSCLSLNCGSAAISYFLFQV